MPDLAPRLSRSGPTGYLDALAEARGLPSRAAALFSIWTRAALVRPNASRLAMPALPPAAAPITAPMRLTVKANGKSVVICQLSGPDWVEHGADALALVDGAWRSGIREAKRLLRTSDVAL